MHSPLPVATSILYLEHNSHTFPLPVATSLPLLEHNSHAFPPACCNIIATFGTWSPCIPPCLLQHHCHIWKIIPTPACCNIIAIFRTQLPGLTLRVKFPKKENDYVISGSTNCVALVSSFLNVVVWEHLVLISLRYPLIDFQGWIS